MARKKQKIIHLSHWQYAVLCDFHALDPKVIYYAEENENPEIAKLIDKLRQKKEKEKMIKNMIETIINVFTMIGLLVLGIWVLVYGGIYMSKKECIKWGGDYDWAAGCLMEYQGRTVVLEDYKELVKVELSKPVPTNTNINLKAE